MTSRWAGREEGTAGGSRLRPAGAAALSSWAGAGLQRALPSTPRGHPSRVGATGPAPLLLWGGGGRGVLLASHTWLALPRAAAALQGPEARWARSQAAGVTVTGGRQMCPGSGPTDSGASTGRTGRPLREPGSEFSPRPPCAGLCHSAEPPGLCGCRSGEEVPVGHPRGAVCSLSRRSWLCPCHRGPSTRQGPACRTLVFLPVAWGGPHPLVVTVRDRRSHGCFWHSAWPIPVTQ